MAKRGRKPKLSGKVGASRKPSIKVPDYLEGVAATEYVRVAERLADAGTLDSTDTRLIELYAINYDLILRAREEILRGDSLVFITDKGGMQQHPLLTYVNAATIRLKGIIETLSAIKPTESSNDEKVEKSGWGDLIPMNVG